MFKILHSADVTIVAMPKLLGHDTYSSTFASQRHANQDDPDRRPQSDERHRSLLSRSARFAKEFREADVVSATWSAAFTKPPRGHSVGNEGFFAKPQPAKRETRRHPSRGHREQRQLCEPKSTRRLRGSTNWASAYRRRHDAGAAYAPANTRARRHALRLPAAHLRLLADRPRAQESAAGVAIIRGCTAWQLPTHKNAA